MDKSGREEEGREEEGREEEGREEEGRGGCTGVNTHAWSLKVHQCKPLHNTPPLPSFAIDQTSLE